MAADFKHSSTELGFGLRGGVVEESLLGCVVLRLNLNCGWTSWDAVVVLVLEV